MGSACSKGVKAGASVSPDPNPRSLQHAPAAGQKSRTRRNSVSAEPSGVRSLPRESVVKPATSTQQIRELVRSTLLFKELDEEQEACVIDAMFERRVSAGEVVIREGEEADNFYVIASGTFAATKAAVGDGAAGSIRVATYEGRGGFGELALMYNCPRAATVTALTDGVLWGVDRATFRSLVVQSMEERRQRHEAALSSMPILQHLTPSQLAAVADCLHQETFEEGQLILSEGAALDASAKFYMIESGTVDCFRTFEGKRRSVGSLQPGDVFGEVALLTKAPRQADCVAASRCKCLTMTCDAFERLMGPAEEVLSQQIAQYDRCNKELEAASKQGVVNPADSSSTDHQQQVCELQPQQEEKKQEKAEKEQDAAVDFASKLPSPVVDIDGQQGQPAAQQAVEVPAEVPVELTWSPAADQPGSPAAEVKPASPAAEVKPASAAAGEEENVSVPAGKCECAVAGAGGEAGGEAGDSTAACGAAPPAACVPGSRSRADTPVPGSSPGSPSLSGGVCVLLPGSPRPPLRLSDSSFSRRRSVHSVSARSSLGSEVDGSSAAGSPTAQSGQLLHQPHAQEGAAASPPVAGDAGTGSPEGGEDAAAGSMLDPIAEEPAEAAAAAQPAPLKRGKSSAASQVAAASKPATSSIKRAASASAKVAASASKVAAVKKASNAPAVGSTKKAGH
ncbi:hypothetical protein D9Q98_009742 [Chlorella vulgaris]|uniref:Cyclic nucleotide-binding domain-containing protein n=1 Tax=Chlorella vulgaris TaxID=3077 RepID=A0A9D4YSQ3_CHLVU|nr:hypothetical protein D9Q98_009742 [Chlorella vulgaris]